MFKFTAHAHISQAFVQGELLPVMATYPPHLAVILSTCIDSEVRHLVMMTRLDLAWWYSELSKYVQFPGQSHMEAAEHILRHLRAT